MKPEATAAMKRSQLAIAASLLFSTAMPALAAPGDAFGPPQAVLPEVAARQSDADVGRGANGTTVVVWRDFLRRGIYGRRFDRFGSPLDSGFPISDIGDIGQAPDVAVAADGDFVVTWFSPVSLNQGGLNNRIRARRFSADGSAATGVLEAAGAPSEFVNNGAPAVAIDDDGDFVVAWDRFQRRESPQTRSIHQVLARRFDRNGNTAAEPVVVEARDVVEARLSPIGLAPLSILISFLEVSSQRSLEPAVDVAMDDSGDFVVVWGGGQRLSALAAIGFGYAPLLSADANLRASSTFYRRYRADGSPLGERRTVDSSLNPQLVLGVLLEPIGLFNTPRRSAPSVAIDTAGRFVVAWSDLDGVGPARVRFRRHDAGGTARGLPVTVSSEVVPGARVAIAAADGGQFVLAWQGSTDRVDARRYQADGRAAAPVFAVSAPNVTLQPFPSVSVASDALGNFAVAWDQFDSGSNANLVQVRSYQGP